MSKIDLIKKELEKIDFKLNTSFKGYEKTSLFLIIFLITLSIISLYNNPFWSYVLLLVIFLTFINILSTKDFTTFNLLKNLCSLFIKPIAVIFIIFEMIFSKMGNIPIFCKIIIGLIPICIYFIFFHNMNKCKYNLDKIKDENKDLFLRSDICSNLDLNNCYSLEELQPCLKDLANDLECNYCMDYDFNKCHKLTDENVCNQEPNCKYKDDICKTTTEYCSNILDDEKCNKDTNCNWDINNGKCLLNNSCQVNNDDKEACENNTNCVFNGGTKECKQKDLTSDAFCDENSNQSYEIKDNNVQCKDNSYCSQKLDVKYCKSSFFGYDTNWVIGAIITINVLLFVLIFIFQEKHCISNKAFILTILLINMLSLALFIFLKNNGDNIKSNEEDF